ncbi:MAG: Nif3-like dinuclear metal center hexameric protein [Christensenellaceae bacterium]|nr:Nif3-like dinuclear metal center hexameric protein [Christensenellaceae bacterium]
MLKARAIVKKMKLSDFVNVMNRLAPPETALGFDNVGLLIGTDRSDIKRVLVALDCTCAVAEEAALVGADLVLTHHPIIFGGVKRILPDDPHSAVVYKLIRSNIAMFAAHTNLDAADGGVNTALCSVLGIDNDVVPVGSEGIMRIGNLPEPILLDDFAKMCELRLCTKVHVSGENRLVQRVAVMGGSGGGDYALAHENGADVYLTGECKHSQAIEAMVLGLPIVIAGHYETEKSVLIPLINYLQNNTDGVEYILAKADRAVFRSV